MHTATRYSKAPLTEAVLDIRVRLPDGTVATDLAIVQSEEMERYPHREEVRQIHGPFLGRGAEILATSASQALIGYRYTSHDRRQIFQAQLGGFTFNRLEPYEHWVPFRDEARRLWRVYGSVARPLAVTRIVLRYINRINIPLGAELKDYFRTVSEVAPDLPQSLSGFVMHLEIPQTDIDGMLFLNQAMVEPPAADLSSVVLDIDLFRLVDIPPDDDAFWGIFERLRVRKNEIFEACITDRVREVIA